MREPHTDGEGPRAQGRQRAVVEAAAVAQAQTLRAVADAGYQQQLRLEGLGVLGLGDAVGVFFHRAARVPDMEAQLLGLAVDDRQPDAPAGLGLAPAEQRRQRVELALDRPVGADAALAAADQPDAQHLLQVHRTLVPVGHGQALGLQLLAQRELVARRLEGHLEVIAHGSVRIYSEPIVRLPAMTCASTVGASGLPAVEGQGQGRQATGRTAQGPGLTGRRRGMRGSASGRRQFSAECENAGCIDGEALDSCNECPAAPHDAVHPGFALAPPRCPGSGRAVRPAHGVAGPKRTPGGAGRA